MKFLFVLLLAILTLIFVYILDKKEKIPQPKFINYYKERLYKESETLEDIIKRGG